MEHITTLEVAMVMILLHKPYYTSNVGQGYNFEQLKYIGANIPWLNSACIKFLGLLHVAYKKNFFWRKDSFQQFDLSEHQQNKLNFRLEENAR